MEIGNEKERIMEISIKIKIWILAQLKGEEQ